MRSSPEYQMCKQIAQYMRLQYPKVIFHFDQAGSNLSIAQAGKMKAIQGLGSWPDLFIAEPSVINGFRYRGLFIEVKVESPYLKDGITIKSNEHLKNQHQTLERLRMKGYYTTFGVGFEGCKAIIDGYLTSS